MNKKTLADVAERIFWTAVQAGVAVIAVDQLDLPAQWVPIAAVVLAAVKAAVATQVGVKGSAAALPTSLDASVLDSTNVEA